MIEDCGPSVGLPTFEGNDSLIIASFSDTICLAIYMSVPQSNSTQTTEKPAVEDDLTRLTSVAPFKATSTGNVTSCSTSSGAKPCASVITTTVGAFKSGKTSTSILDAVYTPASISKTAAIKTTKRLSNENLINLFNINLLPFVY